jgi:hypothetical protein
MSRDARGHVIPSSPYLLPLAMDVTIPFSQEVKPMYSPLGHPYARKYPSTSTLSLAAHFPPVPVLPPIKDLSQGSWHSDSSSGSDYDGPMTAFVSLTGLPSDKRDISPPPVAPHGCPYVKHGSGITVILSGHKAGTSLPLYPSGSLISGVVFFSKLERIESLDVKVGDPLQARRFAACQAAQAHLRSSWKDPSLYAKCRQASGGISSFSLIG